MNFKRDFVKSLQDKVPDKIMDLGLNFDDTSRQLAQCSRFSTDSWRERPLVAVYITVSVDNDDIKDSKVILKFEKERWHGCSFNFTHIYIRKEGENIEKRYDSEMNEVSDYYFESLEDDVFCTKYDHNNPDVKVVYKYNKDNSMNFDEYLSILDDNNLVDNIETYDGFYFKKDNDSDVYMVFKSEIG